MQRPNTLTSRVAALLLVALGTYAAVGCTVIRYVEPNNKSNSHTVPPRELDMLVLVDLDRSAANLTPDYSAVLGNLLFALGEQNVAVRKGALAPLYTRANGAVPLLFGLDDEDGEFGSFEEALAFFAYDGGEGYLQETVGSDSANLATLGKELDSRPIYHPTTSDPSARAYFSSAADGFLVVYLTASQRRCAAGDEACAIDGVDAVQYFSRGDDNVSWLELPGGSGLPANKVFHAAITTAEGIGYDDFYKKCSRLPNFPTAKLDVMEPSSERYFGPFIEGVRGNGGNGEHVDLCEAISSRGESAIATLATKIRKML